MTDNWNVPRPAAKSVLTAHTPAGAHSLVGVREPLPDTEPSITYYDERDGRCLLVLDGLRCTHSRAHSGPCDVVAVSDTGLRFRVRFGQIDTRSDPMTPKAWNVAGERDRARKTAVTLEQQLAAVEALHCGQPLGPGEPHAVSLCQECSTVWPCATARVFIGDAIDLIPAEVAE